MFLEADMIDLPGPDTKAYEHANSGYHEKSLSTKLIYQEDREANGHEERPDLKATVDKRLLIRRLDADRIQDVVDIIGYKTIAGALREERS